MSNSGSTLDNNLAQEKLVVDFSQRNHDQYFLGFFVKLSVTNESCFEIQISGKLDETIK